jgi:endonuclease/exonuclease/phosphatase family metal-dependent hydrolase
MDFQGGAYGVGILSRWPLRRVENHPLPGSPDREPRTSLTAEVRINKGGPLLRFTSTHFDQGRDLGNRVAQANELNHRLVLNDGTPTILAGDLNSGANTEVIQIFDGDWVNASSDPAVLNGTGPRRVDYVLVRPVSGWRVIESRIVDAPIASDHRPVLVVLEWTGNGGAVGLPH